MKIDRATPPSEVIRTGIAVHLSLLSRQTIRDIAGYAVGKRRNLSMVPTIAKEMAKRLMVPLVFSDKARAAGAEDIGRAIEEVFDQLSDEQAFRLASKGMGENDNARDGFALAVAAVLTTRFEITNAPEDERMLAKSDYNGWMAHEAIKSNQEPVFRWRYTWADKADEDYSGYDGDRLVGRVFKIKHVGKDDIWFWLVSHFEGTRPQRSFPFSGWEHHKRSAACRVEQAYLHIEAQSAAQVQGNFR